MSIPETRKSERGVRNCKRGSVKRDQHTGSQNLEPRIQSKDRGSHTGVQKERTRSQLVRTRGLEFRKGK
jgi:hypothetical protein